MLSTWSKRTAQLDDSNDLLLRVAWPSWERVAMCSSQHRPISTTKPDLESSGITVYQIWAWGAHYLIWLDRCQLSHHGSSLVPVDSRCQEQSPAARPSPLIRSALLSFFFRLSFEKRKNQVTAVTQTKQSRHSNSLPTDRNQGQHRSSPDTTPARRFQSCLACKRTF